jgi:hypothetical protein
MMSIPPASTSFFLDLLFNHKDGSDIFLRNTWRYNPEDLFEKVCFPRERKHSIEFDTSQLLECELKLI